MLMDWISRKERYAIADAHNEKFKSLYERIGMVEEHPQLKEFLFIEGSELLRHSRFPEYRQVSGKLRRYGDLLTERIARIQKDNRLVSSQEIGADLYFVSHRWLSPSHPDPDGRQLNILKEHIDPAAYYWLDFSCLPQKPRSVDEEKAFRECIFLLPSLMFKRKFLVLRCLDDGYLDRAWCLFELLAAHVLGGDLSWIYEGGASAAFSEDDEQIMLENALLTRRLPEHLCCTDPVDLHAIRQATEAVGMFSLINLVSHYLMLGQEISDQTLFFAEDRYYFLATCDFSKMLVWTYEHLRKYDMRLFDLSRSELDESIFMKMAKIHAFQHATDIYALPKEITLDAQRLNWLSQHRHSNSSAINLFLLLSSMVDPISASEQSDASKANLVAPSSEISSSDSNEVTDEIQLDFQQWNHPKRLSIELDCPPGDPRPPEVLEMAIAGTSLTASDFEDSGNLGFGCREFLVKPEIGSIRRYREARQILEERLRSYYNRGLIRAASW